MKRFTLAGFSVFSVVAVACAHPQPVAPTSASAQLTAAQTPAAPSPTAAVAPTVPAVPAAPVEEPSAANAVQPEPEASGPMSFEALSAALGDDSKLGLDIDHAGDAPAGKGLAADGYSAVGAMHQVAADTVKHVGELQVRVSPIVTIHSARS
jgi:hypothetical protein